MARRRKGQSVNGWLILDKPQGLTSTKAVGRVKRLYDANKAGHAGTLDPLATGILPIAFGEATKTVPFVVDGTKAYRFTVRFGAETDTDDAEGKVTETSDRRPSRAEIEAALPQFTGEISQMPPRYSALKVDGARAYDLARDEEDVRAGAPGRDHRAPRADGLSRPGHLRDRGRVRQGHLCAVDRPRSRPGARLLRPCGGLAADPGGHFQRGGRHDPRPDRGGRRARPGRPIQPACGRWRRVSRTSRPSI